MTSRKSRNPLRNSVGASTVTLSMRVQPRASKNEIVPMTNGGIKIKLMAPPVDGAANEALITFLAAKLDVSKSQVEIVAGHMGREKIIRISGLNDSDAKRLLNISDK